MGYLAGPVRVSGHAGVALNGSRAYFHALADGLVCPEHKRLASSEMSADSRKLAAQMLSGAIVEADCAQCVGFWFVRLGEISGRRPAKIPAANPGTAY